MDIEPWSVVTEAAPNVGRAITERLVEDGAVVAVETRLDGAPDRVSLVRGDARDPEVAAGADAGVEATGPPTG